MYLFRKKIRCLVCNKNYRGKMQRGKVVYICSTYNRNSSECIRYVLKEEELIHTVKNHVEIYLEGSSDDIVEFVDTILVRENGYEIVYLDKSTSILNSFRAKY